MPFCDELVRLITQSPEFLRIVVLLYHLYHSMFEYLHK
jgi:hypothetical protein